MDIYQHFRQEERSFIDKVIEWKELVEVEYRPKLSDFLNPREQNIVSSVIGTHSDSTVSFFGGTPACERKRALLSPSYFQPVVKDYKVSLFEVQYPNKFVTLDHRNILGALMSLGLKRPKFGDILIKDRDVQIVVGQEISDYIEANFTSIGKTSVSLQKINFSKVIEANQKEWFEKSTSVSSLRLDVVLSSIYNLSRQKVQPLISNGFVKVNWKTVDHPSFECKESDPFSVRGHGRSKLLAIEGQTKKEKWRIIVGVNK